jgi:hypothetical protein
MVGRTNVTMRDRFRINAAGPFGPDPRLGRAVTSRAVRRWTRSDHERFRTPRRSGSPPRFAPAGLIDGRPATTRPPLPTIAGSGVASVWAGSRPGAVPARRNPSADQEETDGERPMEVSTVR